MPGGIVASERWGGRAGCPDTAVSQTLMRSRKKDSGLGATRERPCSVLPPTSAHEKFLLIAGTNPWSRTQSRAPPLIVPAIEKDPGSGKKDEDNLRTVASFSYNRIGRLERRQCLDRSIFSPTRSVSDGLPMASLWFMFAERHQFPHGSPSPIFSTMWNFRFPDTETGSLPQAVKIPRVEIELLAFVGDGIRFQ